MRDWMLGLLAAAIAIIGLAIALRAHGAEKDPWSRISCSQAPVAVEGTDGTAR
jgi:hypothetical protein